MATSRRQFLAGCSAAIASLYGSRFGQFAFAGEPGINDEILIILFLRGGMDGLNFVPPIAGPDRG
ncbi:MAG: twin-arginine translocation signal domain-containing protein, partial [Acidobacteriota bacterium]